LRKKVVGYGEGEVYWVTKRGRKGSIPGVRVKPGVGGGGTKERGLIRSGTLL